MVRRAYQRTLLQAAEARMIIMVLLKGILIITSVLGYFTMYATPKATNTLTSISIESERATYQQHKTPHPHLVCIHEGNVHVTLSNGAHAHADTLEALIRETSGEKKKGIGDAVETITLKNNVTITYQHHTVTGEQALINTSSHLCTVTGNVTITKQEIKGNTIITNAKNATLDLTTNRVTLEGSSEKPVRTLIHLPPRNNPHKHTSTKHPQRV